MKILRWVRNQWDRAAAVALLVPALRRYED